MNIPRKKNGFTLVELMVVITILVILAALSFMIGSKMINKGKSAKMLNNMKQFGPLLSLYTIDHQSQLPACKGNVVIDGTAYEMQWNEVLLSQIYPETDPNEFKTQKWWLANEKLFVNNPLFKTSDTPRGAGPLNPGYGFNLMMPINYETNHSGASPGDAAAMALTVPSSAVDDPSRTPIIAPCDNYYYKYNDAEINGFKSGTLLKFLNEGKMPILFLDGHIEVMHPQEYVDRKLDQMPMPAQ